VERSRLAQRTNKSRFPRRGIRRDKYIPVLRDVQDLIARVVSRDCGLVSPAVLLSLQEESTWGRKIVRANQDLKLSPISLEKDGKIVGTWQYDKSAMRLGLNFFDLFRDHSAHYECPVGT
jgi:hypothetical protein